MTAIACTMRNIRDGTVPVLYNGAAGQATMPVREGAIDASMHWQAIDGVAAAEAVSHTKAYVRCYYGILGATEVIRHNTTAANALPVGPATHANLAQSLNYVLAMPIIRKKAMCLGAVRAGILQMWGVGQNTLIAGETGNTRVLRILNANTQTYHTIASPNLTLAESIAYGMNEFTTDDEDILYALFMLSMAAVPLAGLSILSTGHHYLSDLPAATDAVMRQVLAASSDAVKAWFAADSVVIKDMVWHKSAHPVTSVYLVTQALSTHVATKLRDAGLGSAMVRLPFVEPEVKAARAMVSIVATVQQPILQVGGVLSVQRIVTALEHVEAFEIRAAPAIDTVIDEFPQVRTRNEAIAQILRPATESAVVGVAYALGICGAMLESLPARDRNSTLMSAKSLTRIRREQLPAVTAGAAFYENLMRRDREAAASGRVEGPNMAF